MNVDEDIKVNISTFSERYHTFTSNVNRNVIARISMNRTLAYFDQISRKRQYFVKYVLLLLFSRGKSIHVFINSISLTSLRTHRTTNLRISLYRHMYNVYIPSG